MKIVAFFVMLGIIGCAQVETVSVTRIDGEPCRTTKVRPDWYSAEVWTDCLDKDSHAQTVATNHTDLAAYAALFAFAGGLGTAFGK